MQKDSPNPDREYDDLPLLNLLKLLNNSQKEDVLHNINRLKSRDNAVINSSSSTNLLSGQNLEEVSIKNFNKA